MCEFIEEQFPIAVGFGASGGPQRKTQITTFASGREVRASSWGQSRRRYDAGTGIRSLQDLRQVMVFFERTMGRLIGFRFRDPFDHSTALPSQAIAATDSVLGFGDGLRTSFQLVKHYGADSRKIERVISKPLTGTVVVALDGAALDSTADYQVDGTSGMVSFGVPPAEGVVVSAGFEFDTPVRFDTDQLEASLTHFEAGTMPSVPLVEIIP